MAEEKNTNWLSTIEWNEAVKSPFCIISLLLMIPLGFVYWYLIGAVVIGKIFDAFSGKKIWQPWQFLLKWPITLIFFLAVIFNVITNSDGQGRTNLYEAVTLDAPFRAFVTHEKLLIEESCWNKINIGEGHLPAKEDDQDLDHYPKPCDDNDADPSFTPTKLAIHPDVSDPSPKSTDRVLLEPDYRFEVRAPHLGDNDSIVKVFLYITSDDLTEEDAGKQYYVQECPPRYDHDKEWKLYCELQPTISPWLEYLNLKKKNGFAQSSGIRPLKWRMKYLTSQGKSGDVQSYYNWWNSYSTVWNYFGAISQ